MVVGFPSNDFGNREPGSNKEIADFAGSPTACVFRCSPAPSVAGARQSGYAPAAGRQHGRASALELPQISHRSQRHTVKSFPSEVSPDNALLVATIERLLAAKPTGGASRTTMDMGEIQRRASAPTHRGDRWRHRQAVASAWLLSRGIG